MVRAPARERRRDPVLVWPDMEPAVTVFLALGTQWNTGPAGILGLRYEAIEPTARLMGKDRLAPQSMVDIRLMERAALTQMRKGSKR